MSIAPRFSSSAIRLSFLPAAFALLVGLSCSASAQTAPQLLPYTVKIIAGGGKTAIASGATCPSSGFKSTDAFGDGCLATEIQLTAPRYAQVDATGNIFFSDYTNGLVRRIDAVTGIVTAVAGGATATPAVGSACGGPTPSTDLKGDNCLGTAVKLSHPVGLVFSPTGDLYFGDVGYGTVRKIAATNGIITYTTAGITTTTGVITMVDGQQGATATGGTFGYASNFGTTNVTASAGGFLDDPFSLAMDPSGNLYIADEGTNSVVVVNTSTTTTTTVTGISIPPGTVAKIVGSPTAGGSVCPNGSVKPFGCNFGTFSPGSSANSSQTDAPYAVTFDPAGNVYFANEFLNSVGKISTAGAISIYAGTETSTGATSLVRAQAGTFAFGSDFGIVADANSNVYVTDALNGVVWRIDGATQSMYVVAGGAKSTCSAASDSFGDGCPATQATFGKSGTTFASSSSPGIFGVVVDAYSDLFVGDTITNLVREVSSGTQFGNVGANQPIDIVDIHFTKNDAPASSAYKLTAGATNFSLGSANCTANSDLTTDCLLPIQATPTALGPFTGTLQVTSVLGAVATFPLSGDYIPTPNTRIAVNASPLACAGTTTFTNATPVVLTATIGSSGSPTGTVTFFANGTAIGSPATVTNSVATLTTTFTTPGTYSISATYSGDSYFLTSSTTSSASVNSASPTFTASPTSFSQSTVAPGQTALYSFNVASTYIGSIAFTCSGLPANSSCQFSTTSVTATGCSTSTTVALSILTRQSATALQDSIGLGGKGPWSALGMVSGIGLALLIGLRRRSSPLRFGQIWMALALLLATSGAVACNSSIKSTPSTPAGTYTVTVTATGSAGTVATFTVPLVVN